MESKFKRLHNKIIFCLILGVFFLSFIQSFSQHWSAHFDSDWFNIYNILLLKSGYVQDFYDHPAFTLFFLNSLFLSIFDFFNSNFIFNVDEPIGSFNLDIYFENIFLLARITNSIVHSGCIIILSKILDHFSQNKTINLIFLISFIISNFFLTNLFQIRPERFSVFFFLCAFYLIIK